MDLPRIGAAILLAVSLSAPSRGAGVLDAAGPVASAERLLLLNATVVMLGIVIPVMITALAMAWWFRASNARARRHPDWSYSGRLELVIWSIPALVILFLGGVAWIAAHDLDPGEPLQSGQRPLEIEVVSLDWKWLFIYPETGIASINRLVVPVGVPLHFRLTAATVWNVFWVPQLGSMLYCMNGMEGNLNLQADRPGSFPGMSAMISGDGFASMQFNADAVSPEAFAAWAQGARTQGPALDEQSYRALLVQQAGVPPFTYRSVEPGLFRAIVSQKLPPGAGPTKGKPTPRVRPVAAR